MFFPSAGLTDEMEQPVCLQQRIAGGDGTAFKQLYHRYWKEVYTLAFTYSKSSSAAQDIVQEVFLRLWLKRESLPEVKQIRQYILIVARNYIVSCYRRKGLDITALEELPYDGLADLHLQTDNLFAARQSEDTIHRLIGLLTPKQQEAFFLSREKGLTRNEIACELGISPSTVKNHIHAAICILKDQLQKEDVLVRHYS